MMLRLMRSRAQSTAEYAIVIGLVVAAVLAMQVYVKRGLQAKIKGVVDYQPNVKDQPTIFSTGQFEPNYSASSMETLRTVKETVDTTATGKVTRGIGEEGEVTTKSGSQTTSGLNATGAQVK